MHEFVVSIVCADISIQTYNTDIPLKYKKTDSPFTTGKIK